MPVYAYTARSADGELVRATVKAEARHAALSRLRARQLVPIMLEEIGSDDTHAPRRRGLTFSARVSLADRALFCRQLAISVNSGVPLRESLESITLDMDHAGFRRVLADIVAGLHAGLTFSEALGRHADVFDALFIALVRAAEESGSLPETLEELANTLERRQRLANKVRSITAYPIFVAVFFVLVCAIMTLVVLPRFERIFANVNTELPTLTRMVFGVNRYIMTHGLYFGGGLLALLLALVLFARSGPGRVALGRLALAMPLFGGWIAKYALARFCQNFAIMLQGGVPVATAMEMSAATTGNRIMRTALMDARERIIGGASISASLDIDPRIPRLVVRMTNVGESSGRLPEVLERVSKLYEDQVEASIMTATSLFEPIVICLFGVVVLVLVMAVYMPVFTVAAGGG